MEKGNKKDPPSLKFRRASKMDKKVAGKYDHRLIEPKWVARWEKAGIYKAVDFDKKPKKYVLFEFPYPSGARLHVGHGRSFTALDAMARKYRMQGFNVLLPMGWDAFGLPTENYAIKMGINPSVITQENIANSREQAKRWGLSIDWDREIDTTDPEYYKWTQWIFLKMFEKGLAYRDEVPVNWCPFCKTTLANEEVEVNGTHERCGKPTVQRRQKQWILRITKYADRLLEDLKTVDYLPKIALQQINWIGRSEGAEIEFRIRGAGEVRDVGGVGELRDKENKKEKKDKDKGLTIFTTRPDTLYGATFMVLAPEHWLAGEILREKLGDLRGLGEVREYIEKAKSKSELERTELAKEKTGVFSGVYAINPATGREIPIWISDFVLSTYGTGAIMAVPAHDERDWQFAKKFGLPIVPVILPYEKDKKDQGDQRDKMRKIIEEKPYCEAKGFLVNSGEWDELEVPGEMSKIVDWLEKKGVGKKSVSYHLRDWIFSRQHYWGEPIPMIFCEKCKSEGQGGTEGQGGQEMAGWWPVPEDQLPVKLPNVEKYQPTETGESPLENIKDWVETKCPVCGGSAKRETDTMPNWAGSNWYFLRYIDPKNKKELMDIKKAKYWLPVDLYNGGMEHTTLHLLYSRFIYKFLYDIKVVPTKEPYARRRSHGMVLGPDGQKMSKSRGNTISPDEMIEAFGADTFRLYESFIGPFDQTVAWSQESMEGCYRFLKRVWRLVDGWEERGNKGERGIERKLNQTIKKVGEDIENMKFNTAVAAMMELLNEMERGEMRDLGGLGDMGNTKETKDGKGKIGKEIIEKFLLILAPFAPYITEELWERLGNKFSIHQQKWPEYDPNLIAEEVAIIAIQVNGKLRGTIEVQSSKCKVQSEVEELAKKDKRVKKYLEGLIVRRIIFVPGKLINFVV